MDEKRNPRPWALWIIVVVVLVVAYPLSYGPALFLWSKGILPSSPDIYWPLGRICDQSETVQYIMVEYSELWIPEEYWAKRDR